MKKHLKFGINFGLYTLLFGIVITPFEAVLFNQSIIWMYLKNLSEIFLVNFGLWLGFYVKK
jgi:hypothetical protein